jgi:ribonuclease VapC
MVIDTSSLICVILGEPEAPEHVAALVSQPNHSISSANWLESMLVVQSRRGDAGRIELGNLLDLAGVEIVPVDSVIAYLAFDAWLRFGKGRHPASLNFGDCFSYALAKFLGEPLLFKGEDFSKTDITAAI